MKKIRFIHVLTITFILLSLSFPYSVFTMVKTNDLLPSKKLKTFVTKTKMTKDPLSLRKDFIDKILPKAEYKPGEIIVKLKPGKTLASLSSLNQNFSISQSEKLFKDYPSQQKQLTTRLNLRQLRAQKGIIAPDINNIYLIKTKLNADMKNMVKAYKNHPCVLYAEPNYKVKTQAVPNDPYYSSSNSWGQGYGDLWGLKNMKTTLAWDLTQGENALVAVVDTGIDYTHPDITANLWINAGEIPNNGVDDDNNGIVDDYYGCHYLEGQVYGDPRDDNGHGTHVAGTIAAVGNNNLGIIGVAPKAKIIAAKGLDREGSGYIVDLANCINYVVNQGADVINNSWGGSGNSQLIEDAIKNALAKGCVVVVAAGNSNANTANFFPANVDGVIAVAASDQNDQKCFFSNWGEKVDVAAPGGNGNDNPYNILSLLASNSLMEEEYKELIIGNNYLRIAGTSMAAPHISAVCALVISKYPMLTNKQVRVRIMQTTDCFPTPPPQKIGTGRVNAYRALTEQPGPYLEIKKQALFDNGNGNLIPESGEQIKLTIALENNGESAQSVTATLKTTNPEYISVETAAVSFGSIASGQTKENTETPFIFRIGKINYDTPANFLLTINANGNVQEISFRIDLGIRKITSENAAITPYMPACISEDKIVWFDMRNESDNLYLYNLTTNQEEKINTINSTYSPKIDKNNILGEGYDNNTGLDDIYLYNLTNNSEINLSKDAARQGSCDIYDNWAAWQDYGYNGTSDLMLYNLETQEKRAITQDAFDHYYPNIFKDKIAWFAYLEEEYNTSILFYDIKTQITKRLPQAADRNQFPCVYNNYITWEGIPDDNTDVFLYNTDSQQIRKLSDNEWYQGWPQLDGNNLIWEDFRNDSLDIYLYRLDTNQLIPITTESSHQVNPAISGNKVIWMDSRNGKWDIYMTELKD